ncbi:MAG TPA: alpha/beta fold hydrolase [Streptosporangiaceae bacterium]|jgi:triacylglycerol esterase/lipase EstA (alpha/beta hydrolase family)|nr:alpha/beta fold hydrolase [Streptosporangiaceae bacterium]
MPIPLPLPTHPRRSRRRRWLAAAAVAGPALTVALTAALPAGTAAASPAQAARPAAGANLPVTYNFLVGVAAALANPSASPPGANNWSCKPSAAHPYPVVLVNGTGEDMADGFSALSPLLADNGYCVFAANVGGSPGNLLQGTGDITQSAAELATFVTQVLSTTGAAKVDIVGHSQGGMMPRYYLKFLGGAAKVQTLVGLAPSNHGTSLDGLATLETELATVLPGISSALGSACEACAQQIAGSSFLTNLNAGGDTVAGPSYTVIETRNDEIVTPYTSAFLSGPDVTNILLQNVCPLDQTDHIGIADDTVALHLVLNALDPAHPQTVPCVPVLPILGG